MSSNLKYEPKESVILVFDCYGLAAYNFFIELGKKKSEVVLPIMRQYTPNYQKGLFEFMKDVKVHSTDFDTIVPKMAVDIAKSLESGRNYEVSHLVLPLKEVALKGLRSLDRLVDSGMYSHTDELHLMSSEPETYQKIHKRSESMVGYYNDNICKVLGVPKLEQVIDASDMFLDIEKKTKFFDELKAA